MNGEYAQQESHYQYGNIGGTGAMTQVQHGPRGLAAFARGGGRGRRAGSALLGMTGRRVRVTVVIADQRRVGIQDGHVDE